MLTVHQRGAPGHFAYKHLPVLDAKNDLRARLATLRGFPFHGLLL